ncbi:MAG: hypothetical protein NW201_11880 [Gemmatimonadales bacterium]|nr:hypothetical protein [Gemmatimonadales bacterium]
MNLVVGSVAMGLLLSVLGVGVLVMWRVFRTLDLTADGAFGLGAAAGAILLAGGHGAAASLLGATAAGYAAGLVTGLLRTALGVDALLAGILSSAAAYSVSLLLMHGSDVPLGLTPTLFTWAEGVLGGWFPGLDGAVVLDTPVGLKNWAALVTCALVALGTWAGITWFFLTRLGLAIRAVGSSPAMARALGAPIKLTVIVGLVLANGLVGFCGGLFVQYQGFANIQMGIGMIVTGLASVVLGEALLRPRSMGGRVAAVMAGAVAFRLAIAAALRAGLDPNLLKLVTAVVVLVALVTPKAFRRLTASLAEDGAHG